ncbi:hypothetical protein ACOSP7_031322 [Xanthoceras sorbifolium]
MLAKQCWRLIDSPNSLAGRVLKSVYFPCCAFLDARLGSSPSLVWKSFLWGRDLVALGSRWRIGNGESTFVYRDRWIPKASSFKPISPVVLDSMLTVASLNSFLSDDASLILNLPCSSTIHADSLIWHADRAGLYSIKSGYWTAFNHKLQLGLASSSSLAGSFWWKILWNLKIPSKIKLLCWKGCHGLLPTVQVLRSRHMHSSNGCLFCGNPEKSILHALWFCPSLKTLGEILFV